MCVCKKKHQNSTWHIITQVITQGREHTSYSVCVCVCVFERGSIMKTSPFTVTNGRLFKNYHLMIPSFHHKSIPTDTGGCLVI